MNGVVCQKIKSDYQVGSVIDTLNNYALVWVYIGVKTWEVSGAFVFLLNIV